MGQVALDAGEYWKLQALVARTQVAQAEAARWQMTRDTELRRLCVQHGLDPERAIRTDDATCALIQDEIVKE